jgi:hypothetical protein
MKEESIYGNNTTFIGNDEYAFCGNHSAPAGCTEEIKSQEEQAPLDLHNSNSQLNKFLYYYSSKL